MQINHQHLITVAEAAQIIGVTKQAVRDFIRQGDLPGARKISSLDNAAYVIPEAEVQSLAARRKQTNSQ